MSDVATRSFTGFLAINQWIILVLVIGGRDYITPQKAGTIPGFFSGIFPAVSYST